MSLNATLQMSHDQLWLSTVLSVHFRRFFKISIFFDLFRHFSTFFDIFRHFIETFLIRHEAQGGKFDKFVGKFWFFRRLRPLCNVCQRLWSTRCDCEALGIRREVPGEKLQILKVVVVAVAVVVTAVTYFRRYLVCLPKRDYSAWDSLCFSTLDEHYW